VETIATTCLSDNYCYLIVDRASSSAIVVDPGEASPVIRALGAARCKLIGILATHHHSDHVAGISELIGHFGALPVLAHVQDNERTPHVSCPVEDDQISEIGPFRVRVIHVPGHTLGSVSYYIEDSVFTGDTLFASGCGRVFEGTPQLMVQSLKRLQQLPPETKVYFGHEYTVANLHFALLVDPDNEKLRSRLQWAEQQRQRGRATTPSTIVEESATNPFLRCNERSICDWAATQGLTQLDETAVFARLRQSKNEFRG
jgi:hydroxyacylglutathione hydrolase